jgi:predicted phosphate transport protein (TIGR00153 family)
MFRLLPREDKYFELFNRQASYVVEASVQLDQLFEDFENREGYVNRITEIENLCDEVTHQIIKKLNQTFITPIDREDIHALAGGLDDIVDAIEYTARRVMLYRIGESTDYARNMTKVLLELSRVLEKGIQSLESDSETAMKSCLEIHRLESEGDISHRAAIDSIFANETDALRVIKYEDVANVIEAIVLKNS